MHAQFAPIARQRRAQPVLAPYRVTAHPARDVHGVGPGLVGHPAGLLDHVTDPHHQPAAPLPQGRVEVGQAVGQERRPVGHGETGAADAGVDDEERDHAFRVPQSSPQDRVVVHSQIRGEQGDRDAHGSSIPFSGSGPVQGRPIRPRPRYCGPYR